MSIRCYVTDGLLPTKPHARKPSMTRGCVSAGKWAEPQYSHGVGGCFKGMSLRPMPTMRKLGSNNESASTWHACVNPTRHPRESSVSLLPIHNTCSPLPCSRPPRCPTLLGLGAGWERPQGSSACRKGRQTWPRQMSQTGALVPRIACRQLSLLRRPFKRGRR